MSSTILEHMFPNKRSSNLKRSDTTDCLARKSVLSMSNGKSALLDFHMVVWGVQNDVAGLEFLK